MPLPMRPTEPTSAWDSVFLNPPMLPKYISNTFSHPPRPHLIVRLVIPSDPEG